MELQGTVKKLTEIQTFASGFQKRELILLTQEQYPQPISVEFLQDKINLLDNIAEGENVKIGINIRGREWTSPQGEVKYFNSITGWRIEKVTESNMAAQPTQASPNTGNTNSVAQENPFIDNEEDDNLPF
ncbi:MAG: DUF3127 domain-containing protein [Bacteroidetes bacterium]|jgi:hypothetical protein|nr:DUF3127 domain-containing protein [Bacteroidota bacterium]